MEVLKFKIKACLKDNTIEETQNSVLTFFRTQPNQRYNCEIEFEKFRHSEQDLIYKEKLYEMIVNVTLHNCGVIHNVFANFTRSWCDKQDQWLIPIVDGYFYKKKAVHHNVEIKGFSFGTVPDMNYFVPHYNYLTYNYELFCSFYHVQKFFSLFIKINHHRTCTDANRNLVQKIVVRYNSILRVFITDSASPGTSLDFYFVLSSPPFVYLEREVKKKKSIYNLDFDIDDLFNKDNNIQRKVTEKYESSYQWERHLSFGCNCMSSLCSVKDIGKSNVFKLSLADKVEGCKVLERIMHRCPSTVEFCFVSLKTILLPEQLNEMEIFTPAKVSGLFFPSDEIKTFDCVYAWQLLFSRTVEIRDQINMKQEMQKSKIIDQWRLLEMKLLQYANSNPDVLCKSLYHINDMLTRNDVFDFLSALKVLYDHYKSFIDTSELPKGMCLVRRVILTPSKMVLLPPSECFDNRVIREFPGSREYLIRVFVQDDNFSKLTFAVQYHSKKEDIMATVAGEALKAGFQICNRFYEVLASSSSQLREHGIWVYSKNSNLTAAYIRKQLGDFSHITNVAKYMARMGQCFSTSDDAIQIALTDENEKSIPDIEVWNSTTDKYIFSDGIGKISPNLAAKIRSTKEDTMTIESRIAGDVYKPSAFQIRYRGCKGMVAEDPNDMTMNGKCILAYRPSMEKFKCTTQKLEILKISAPRQLYLNRPLISILEQLGVKTDVFLNLQKSMILDLTNALIYEDKAVAMLECYFTSDINFRDVREAGILLTEEPFFRSLLITIYQYCVEKLKSKARIAVPPKYGRNMLGVLDETGTLNYGEIFVQYSEELSLKTSRTHILKGTVVVTKNPCMHPGDVRKLRAVDIPLLHHHKDVIVFPAKGPRPHPDEMAGSDLDGDEFVVIWMPDLIFPFENYPPMKYPTLNEKKHYGPITVKDMVNFFCEFILNDNIGTLAYAHLAWGDLHQLGIFSDVCISLAKKYPYVLDFAKTGNSESLSANERALLFPDFMEKGSSSNSYRSKRTLGVLYRFIRSIEACVHKANLANHKFRHDKLLEYPGWEAYAESAEQHRLEYITRLTCILNKYSIANEPEALSGYILISPRCSQKQHEIENTATIVKKYLISTMRKYRYIFLSELENEAHEHLWSAREKLKRRFQKASAWYMVTYKSSSSGIYSFPWVLSDILIEIRQEMQSAAGEQLKIQSCLLSSLDRNLLSAFRTMSSVFACTCMTIAPYALVEWMVTSKLSLTMFSTKKACDKCYKRIFFYFLSNTGLRCCSWKDDSCRCSTSCSPTELIIAFMKFYLSSIVPPEEKLGVCPSCKGFKCTNLQSVALKTYVSFAITRSYKTLGVKDSTEIQTAESNEEGDPIRIELKRELKPFFTDRIDNTIDLLKRRTFVKDIQISVEKDRKRNEYILVSSTGTKSQRYDLEELIMNSELCSMLQLEI